eukprot:TRINITY_DN455_c0_g2_i1.p1 TRINITY_DN455_c0_g2~~TRINITY_DN455_c0_g2_i1.p1  ORF type:complete len:1474 (-),score=364.80 TRINITY_DN455_c0_g2_i1:29-4450(-)
MRGWKLVPVVLLVCFLAAAVAETTFYGSNVFMLESLEVPTTVTIQPATGITNYTVTVYGSNGADESWARWDGAMLRLTQHDPTGSSLGLTPSKSTYYLALLLAPLLLFGFDPKKIIFFAALIGLFYLNAQAAGGSYSVVVKVPTGFTMETILIMNQNGDVNGNGFNTRNFIALIGQNRTGGSGRLTLNSAGIMKVANIVTAEDVQISGLTPLSNALQMNISPGKPESSSIQVNSYFGSFNIIQGSNFNTTFSGSHCSWTAGSRVVNGDNSTTTTSGFCSPPSRSNFVINTTQSISGAGKLNVDFGAATCTPSWVDPVLDSTDIDIPNPTISTEVASQTYTYNANNRWAFQEEWSSSQGNVTAGATPNELSVNSFALGSGGWHSGSFWLLCDECLPALRKGLNYNLTFSFKLGLNSSQVVKSIIPGLFINPKYRSYFSIQKFSIANETDRWLAVGPELLTAPTTISSTYTTFSANLTPSADLYSGVWRWNRDRTWEQPNPASNLNPYYVALGIRILFAQDPGTMASTYYFKDVTFTQPSFTFTAPQSLVDGSGPYFTPRKPSTLLDPNPRGSQCAWTQSGVKQWHDPATWGGSVPAPGAAVTIPANTKVVVGACIPGNSYLNSNSTSSQFYPKITIPAGSALIFTDAVINIRVRDILVQGNLTIGTQNCRVFSPMSITFHGSNTGQDTIGTSMGSKGIGVDGILDIHAKQYHYTWTRLAANAAAGDDRIYLQDAVNWEPGQEVLITTTFYQDDWWDQNEIRVIKAIDYSMNIVQFTQPLSYNHYAGDEYQAEIGLLSRRVLLQGNPSDSINAGFGGHVMIRNAATGRFSGVQATAMGQTNLLARYPYHFHLLYENGSNSFIHDSSCKNTLYRCITVHGSYNVDIQRNVGYRSIGHSFYMEDGVEENNTFAYNLAVNTQIIGTPAAGEFQGGITVNQAAGLTQPADISAAGFYITNAMNTYIGNAASGGWTGFAFPNLFIPINEHQTWKMDPSARPLKLFDGNTAHSAGYYWGSGCCIYVGGNLKNNGQGGPLVYLSGRIARNTRWPFLSTDVPSSTAGLGWTNTSPQAFMSFNNSKTFLCQKGINHWGNTVELTNYESHDNTLSATVFGQAWMGGALINGKSNNPIRGTPTGRGFQFYDTYVQSILTDVTFKNFNHDPSVPLLANGSNSGNDNTVLFSMTHSDKYKPQAISTTNRIKFENVDNRMRIGHFISDTGSSRYYNFIDTDGSFTNSNGIQLVGGANSGWWIINDNCRLVDEWNVYVCPKTNGVEVVNIIIEIPNLINSDPTEGAHYTSIHVGTMSLWGDGLNQKYNNRTTIITTMPGVTGVSNIGWYMYLNANGNTVNGYAPRSFSINTLLVPKGTWIMFAVSYPAGTTFNITADNRWWTQGDGVLKLASSLDQVKNGKGNEWYWFDGRVLYFKLENLARDNTISSFERGGARLYGTDNAYVYYVTANCQADANGNCASQWSIPTARL